MSDLAQKYDNAYTYLENAYAYNLTYSKNIGSKLDSAYTYLENAYAYNLTYSQNIGGKLDSAYTYLIDSYSYTLSYASNLAKKYDNAYTYLENAYAYIYKNYLSVIPNNNYSKLYIWTGTASELPAIENRFKNVIYIVTDEQETELPEYNG